jgi:hypothetical protein
LAYAPDTSKTPNPGKSLIAADGVGRVATSNAEGGVDADEWEAILEEERRKLNYIAPTEMSCFFLYSASRRASLSAQASVTVYYLFELQSPHVNASTKFNSFRNRTDAERFVGVGLGGVLEHVTIEEISESTANKLKHGPPKQIDGGVLYGVDQTDYRQMHSTWQRILRMFQK